jgi:hypothetical protein
MVSDEEPQAALARAATRIANNPLVFKRPLELRAERKNHARE